MHASLLETLDTQGSLSYIRFIMLVFYNKVNLSVIIFKCASKQIEQNVNNKHTIFNICFYNKIETTKRTGLYSISNHSYRLLEF